MKIERPSDLVDVLAGLLILAYMIGCPMAILLIWSSR